MTWKQAGCLVHVWYDTCTRSGDKRYNFRACLETLVQKLQANSGHILLKKYQNLYDTAVHVGDVLRREGEREGGKGKRVGPFLLNTTHVSLTRIEFGSVQHAQDMVSFFTAQHRSAVLRHGQLERRMLKTKLV